MDKDDVAQAEDITPSGPSSLAEKGTLLVPKSQPREASTTEDHTFLFWDSVYSAAESNYCPKKHADAMAMPQAQGVRDAEINEYLSHVRNATFGPALEPQQFAPGPALKAVWVYSRSKRTLALLRPGLSCKDS